MITVRRAAPVDATAIALVHVRAWQAAYRGLMPDDVLDRLSVDERALRWRDILSNPDGVVLVAVTPEHAGGVTGFCSLIPSRDEDAASGTAEIAALYVAPERWRAGLGTALLASALVHAKRRGYTQLTLWVVETNAAGRRFYEALGLSHDGARKDVVLEGGGLLNEVRYRVAISMEIEAPSTLPILETLREAVSEVVRHRAALLRAVAAPTIVRAALEVSVGRDAERVLAWAITAATWLLSTMIAVSCHRIVLLGPASLPNPNGVFLSIREIRFTWWTLAALMASFAISIFVLGTGSFLVRHPSASTASALGPSRSRSRSSRSPTCSGGRA